MSSLSYFGQKKKKQALRRLSQSPSLSTSRSNKQERPQQSWPPRRRSREDADDVSPGKSDSGLRETKRTRASRQSSGDSNSNSNTLFTGQRIVRSDDNKSLVISKSARDTSGSDSDVSRSSLAYSSEDPGHMSSSDRAMAGQVSGGSVTTGGFFRRLQTGHLGQDEAGNTSSMESPKMNPFATRVTKMSETTNTSGAAPFQFAVPVSTPSAVPSVEVQFPQVSSGFGQSSFGSNKSQGTFGQSVFSSSSEPGQPKGFGNFTFTIKQTSAGSTGTSTTDTSSAAGVPQGSTVGPQSSTINTFTFRQPGRAKSIEADTSNVFGVPQGSKQGPSAKDSAGIFGIKPDIPKSESSFTFAKPKSDGFKSVQNVSPPKRPASTDYHHGDSYTKRSITKWTEDIADLETFGSEFSKPHQADKASKQSLVKKSRLVSKAIADAVSNKSRGDRSEQGRVKEFRDRSSDGSRRDKEYSDRKPDGSRRSEGRRERDEGSRRKEAGDVSKLQKSLSSRTAASSSTSSSTRRYTTPDEIQKLHSIVIKHVPDIANSRSYLKKFFSEYGNVTKVNSMPRKAMAIIHFDNHDSAATAKKKVRILKPNTKPVEIFWVQSDTSSSRSSNRSSSEKKSDKPSSKDSYMDRALAPMNRTSNVPADKPKTRPKDTGSIGSHKKQVLALAHERMEKLEVRDKIIRQEIKKRSKMSTYRALKGVCPDMCPERERYMREYQRRLSMYETLTAPDKVHHPHAIKEYSRSSADQEEPLPHELRPAPILMMTMNYLMNNIMDRGEDGRWEDWFDFLWNRTRAIRKDITQQHLYGVTAVGLMEKCARFHIFCAHRLCEQDRAIFDPKINNENLTKCLQSLKQFYQDLANEGVFCPSEAEFRGYDILLNLNEGDTLRQVQQYRPEVQGSEDVTFGLKAIYALNSNNYVKFFKLVRSATYLNACIMHRYFTQMRNRAVVIMSNAYSPPRTTQTTQYPLDDLKRLLAFEAEPEATEFCMAHGLTVSDRTIHFSRSSFFQPESATDAVHSVSIIETKNNKSVGEVVNGAPLPPNYIHEPSSSFTESGQYKGDITSSSKSVELPTQKAVETIEPTCSTAPPEDTGAVAPPPIKEEEPMRAQYSNAAVKDVAKDMFIDVINEMSRELSENFLQWVHFVQMGSFELVNKILGESIGDLSLEVVLETMREEQGRIVEERRAEQRVEQERQAALAARKERQVLHIERLRQESIDRVSAEAVESIVQEILMQESNNVAIAQYRGVQMQLRQESIVRCTQDISSDILQESLAEECYQIAGEVIQVSVRQRDEKLAELEKCVLMSRTARYLQKWQRVYTLRVRLKRSQLTFPAAPPNQSLTDQLQALWPSRDRQHADRQQDSASMVTLESPFSVISNRETVAKTILRRHYIACLRKQKAWAPFDLPEMLHSILDRSQHATHSQLGHLYWKLVMSLPDAGPPMSHDLKEGLDWLQAKLRRGKLQERFCEDVLHDSDKVQTLSLYTAEAPARQGHHCLPMRLCTKVTKGHVSDYELGSNQLLGTSAVLFVLEDLNEMDWSMAHQRLISLLEAKPMDPATPLLITIMNDLSSSINVHTLCEDRLRLQDLQHEGLLSVYHTITLAADIEDPSSSERLSEGIQWLAEHRPYSPRLTENSLRGYVDTGLMELFSLPLHEDSKLRGNAGLPEQDVQNVVALYNAVILHLSAVASSVNLLNLSWPVAEFSRTLKQLELPKTSWNLPKTLRLLNNRLLGLQLHRVPSLHPDCDWRVVCESLQNYICEQLPGSDVDKAPLISRVQWLLDRSRRSFRNTCYLTYDTPGCEPTGRHIPWTHILEACITHMVSLVSAEDDNYSDDDPVTVYYFESEFDAFIPPQKWKQATTTTREDTFTQLDSLSRSVLDTVLQRQTELSDKHSSENLSQVESVPKVILADEAPSVVAAKDTAEHLKIMLHKEKEETQRYEELLSSWLNDSTPQDDSQRRVESTDIGAPLTVQISQWHDGRPIVPSPDEGAVAREEKRAVSEGDDTLSERLEKLKQQIAMEKRADELQEFRLVQMLGS